MASVKCREPFLLGRTYRHGPSANISLHRTRKCKHCPHRTGDQLQQSYARPEGQAHPIHGNAHTPREACPGPWAPTSWNAPQSPAAEACNRSQITSAGSRRLLSPSCLSNLATNPEAMLPGAAPGAGLLTTGKGSPPGWASEASSQHPPEGARPCTRRLSPTALSRTWRGL